MRCLAIKKPVPPVAAIAGINMNSPGITIKLLTIEIDSPEPNNSTRMLEIKNVPMDSVVVIAATKCILCFMIPVPYKQIE